MVAVLLVRRQLSALTSLTWTDVGQARLPDVHAKFMYIIEPPEPSREARRILWQSILRQQIARLNKLIFPSKSTLITLLQAALIKHRTQCSPMEHLRRKPEDNQHHPSSVHHKKHPPPLGARQQAPPLLSIPPVSPLLIMQPISPNAVHDT